MRKRFRRLKGWLPAAFSVLLTACGSEGGEENVLANVTFYEHISPILERSCVSCHQPGGAGHFSVQTYAEARRLGPSMAYVTKERLMPPWPADHHYTSFVAERILSEREIAVIQKWVASGMQEGKKTAPGKALVARSQMRPPDMRIPVTPFQLKGAESDKFLLVKVPFELPSDTFAAAIGFEAGRGNVVHHVNGDLIRYTEGAKKNVFEGAMITEMVNDSTIKDAYRKLALQNDDGTYPALQRSVVNYLPGVFARAYPGGIGGYLLPRKGAFLLNDLHYGGMGKDIIDSSYINIWFSKTPPKRPVQEFQLGTLGVAPVKPDLVIPANSKKNVVSRYKIPADISILTVNPHMHLIGKTFRAYALTPQADTIRLISIPRWDFNWQYFYTFRKPLRIPAGSTIVAEGFYDNTRENLYNPFSPPQTIRDREGSMRATDEMFQLIITYLPYQPGDENISLE